MYKVLTCLGVEHDWKLVVLAGVVCFLGSSAALSLLQRAKASQGHARFAWMALQGAVAGSGIWATHFIAMLAYDPGIGAGYNMLVTALSLLLAILITGLGFGIALLAPLRWRAAIGGAIVGLGVAAMHYTGMSALELPARIDWDVPTVLASVAIGSALGALALVVALGRERNSRIFLAPVLLTLAIVSHHFTAMGAVTLIPDPTLAGDGLNISPTVLSFLVAAAALIILGTAMVASSMDRRAKRALNRQKVLLDAALENMSQGLCMFDADGRILLFNEQYTRMMGRSDIELEGRLLRDVLHELKESGRWDGDADELVGHLIVEAREGRSSTNIVVQSGRSIRIVHQPMQGGGGWVATFEDITEWQRAQAQITHMARHDALTNLPNRTLFREQLEQALRLAKRGDKFAVLCLDLDHFKDINDSLGHPIGDALLMEVGRRLSSCVSEGDTVARLGGDEFVIVQFCGSDESSPAVSLASRIVEAISEPYHIGGHQLVIGVSVGISLAPDDGKNPDELLKKADLALYRAKADGRGTYRFFETGMDARAQARRLLELDMRAALPRGEFEMHYQPIRDVAADRIVACEALVRWRHPLRGLIPPGNFIPLAEETGLIVQIGEWVLRTACRDAAAWPDDIGVAVNLSPVQFKNPNLMAHVLDSLAQSGLPAHRVRAAAEQRGDACHLARAARPRRAHLTG
jgi:diguanylate cyclase (GGDEF)-like protein/PAS domain S-box-containing protein